MGKQLVFYMLPEDEIVFLNFIFTNNDVLLKPIFFLPEIEVIDGIDKFLTIKDTHVFLIWNRAFTIETDLIKQKQERIYDNEQGIYRDTGRKYYAMDFTNGPFIQYARSFLNNENALTWGRISANMLQIDDGGLVSKGEEFNRWYDKYARWLRKNLRR